MSTPARLVGREESQATGDWEHAAVAGVGEYYWDIAARTQLGKYITEMERAFLVKSFEGMGIKAGLIVDAGAGSGRLTGLLSDYADHLMATEITPGLLGTLPRVDSNVTPVLVARDTPGFPVRSQVADCLVCIEVPISSCDWFPNDAARILHPGGMLIVTLQNRHSWKGLLARFVPKRYATSGAYRESMRDFCHRLSLVGFVLEGAMGFNWLPFSRASDNPLVPVAAKMEGVLQLRRLPYMSPWAILRFRRSH